MQKQSSSKSRSSALCPVRRKSSSRARIASCFASYSMRRLSISRYRGFNGSANPIADDKTGGILRPLATSKAHLAARLNNRIRYEATISLLYLLARRLDRIYPAPNAYPHLPHLVWKALKSGANARQEINLQAAEDLLKATNDIASIFWKTKGFETITAKAPYPTERLTVYPKFK